jgi:hypothetical protein
MLALEAETDRWQLAGGRDLHFGSRGRGYIHPGSVLPPRVTNTDEHGGRQISQMANYYDVARFSRSEFRIALIRAPPRVALRFPIRSTDNTCELKQFNFSSLAI